LRPHFFAAATAAARGDDSRGGEKMLQEWVDVVKEIARWLADGVHGARLTSVTTIAQEKNRQDVTAEAS
jgi:hypothetical protein